MKKNQARGPHRRRSAEPRQNQLCENRLDQEKEKSAEENRRAIKQQTRRARTWHLPILAGAARPESRLWARKRPLIDLKCINKGLREPLYDLKFASFLWHREESQDFAHDAIALVGLEKELSVRGTFQNDQFLRLRSFIVLCTNARKPWAGIVGVVPRDVEQSS